MSSERINKLIGTSLLISSLALNYTPVQADTPIPTKTPDSTPPCIPSSEIYPEVSPTQETDLITNEEYFSRYKYKREDEIVISSNEIRMEINDHVLYLNPVYGFPVGFWTNGRKDVGGGLHTYKFYPVVIDAEICKIEADENIAPVLKLITAFRNKNGETVIGEFLNYNHEGFNISTNKHRTSKTEKDLQKIIHNLKKLRGYQIEMELFDTQQHYDLYKNKNNTKRLKNMNLIASWLIDNGISIGSAVAGESEKIVIAKESIFGVDVTPRGSMKLE